MATMRNGPTVHLTVTNHPSGGPVFAGAAGAAVDLQDGRRLPGADERAVRRRAALHVPVHGRRRRTRSSRKPRRRLRAASIAMTTTDQGVDGAVHRPLSSAARWIAGSTTSPCSRIRPASWAPWASQPGWNHKVLYQFGGGTAPWHTNGAPRATSSTSRSRAGSWSRTTTSTSAATTRTTSSPRKR